jgi:hypothetical protein
MQRATNDLVLRLCFVVVVCLTLAACATTGGADEAASLAAPADYKKVVAAKLHEIEDVRAIRSAEITAPHKKWMGLIAGGMRQVVCVRLVRPAPLGGLGDYHYIFLFNNGKVEDVRHGSINNIDQILGECREQTFTDFTKLVRA